MKLREQDDDIRLLEPVGFIIDPQDQQTAAPETSTQDTLFKGGDLRVLRNELIEESSRQNRELRMKFNKRLRELIGGKYTPELIEALCKARITTEYVWGPHHRAGGAPTIYGFGISFGLESAMYGADDLPRAAKTFTDELDSHGVVWGFTNQFGGLRYSLIVDASTL